MSSPVDEPSLSVEEIRVAAIHGQLPALAERLAKERSWPSLLTIFERAAALPVSLAELAETVRLTTAALEALPAGRRTRAAAEEARAVRILAGEAILKRVARPPLTEMDRQALRAGATSLGDAGDLHRAGAAFEEALDFGGAAEMWGRMGDLDRMEACLAREEGRLRSERATLAAVRDSEALMASGSRAAALRLAEGVADGSADAAAARSMARALAAGLVRARAVTLRTSDGRRFRFAASPAALGRDPMGEIPLRDPGVSRRHALLETAGGQPALSDAGSRAGTFVGGARLGGVLALQGRNEVTLGSTCRLLVEVSSPERVVLRGVAGLDRALVAVVGAGALPLACVVPEAAGVWIEIDGQGARLGHLPEVAVRVGGQLMSPRIDLLHGDVLEIGGDGLRFEVE